MIGNGYEYFFSYKVMTFSYIFPQIRKLLLENYSGTAIEIVKKSIFGDLFILSLNSLGVN